MDPNATLALIAPPAPLAEARAAARSLALWCAKGGFHPDWNSQPEAAARYRRILRRSRMRDEVCREAGIG